MAFIEPNPTQATEKAGGKGTITIVKLLTDKELDGKCDMYAKVIIPPTCSIGVHEHHGNTETYHILSGTPRLMSMRPAIFASAPVSS